MEVPPVFTGVVPQRTSVEDCAGASLLLHHLHRCHKQALPCPRPPPTWGAQHWQPLLLTCQTSREQTLGRQEKKKLFPLCFSWEGGSRKSWLFKSWANSQTALVARAAGVFDSGLPISRSEESCAPPRPETSDVHSRRDCVLGFGGGQRSDSHQAVKSPNVAASWKGF